MMRSQRHEVTWAVFALVVFGVVGDAAGEGLAADREVTFTDVTEEAGIRFRHDSGGFGRRYMPETMGSGCGFLDYDGDGHPDILLINNMAWPEHKADRQVTMALYRNQGDGTFVDVTRQAGLNVEMYGMGCAVGDYDNDGDDDFYVACLGPNHLFRNEGDGAFSDVTEEMGVGDAAWSVGAVWLDYDRDGDLDLFVVNYLKWTRERTLWLDADGASKVYTPQLYDGEFPRLYRNDGEEGGRSGSGAGRSGGSTEAGATGGWKFSDVSKEAGIQGKPGKGMSAAALDYDDDGWPDIAVSNDTLPNFLYRNNRDGTFTEDSILSGVALSGDGVTKSGMGIDAADSRNTGRPDLAIGSFTNEMFSLFWNEGKGYFTDRAVPAGVGYPSVNFVTFGVFFFDYDLDGHLDLFAASGHVESEIHRMKPHMTYAQRPLLFHNRGDGSFLEVGESSGDLKHPLVGRGAAYADYDGDGDLDILVSTNNGRPALFRNDGGDRNHGLRVKLEGGRRKAKGGREAGEWGNGRKEEREKGSEKAPSLPHSPTLPLSHSALSNRSGIGAKVRACAGSTVQTQFVKAGSSYCSQSEFVMTFGLGERREADEVEVVWPGGCVERLEGVKAGQTVTVREGHGIVSTKPFRGTLSGK